MVRSTMNDTSGLFCFWRVFCNITPVRLRYLPPTSNTYMRLNEFVRFNVQQLHSHLLKFHYHQNGGILCAADGFATYSTAFLTQLESARSPLLPSNMLPWMRWSRQVLGNVVSIIGLYCGRHLMNYLIEDKNRVAFLAFEFVLHHLDALSFVIENWDKTLLLELRLIFITYHTNISYETGIRTLFLSDQQLSSASFAFDRPPDSSQSSNQDSHKGATTSSSSSSPSSSSRTSSQTVSHDEYLRQLQVMRSEIDSLKAALHNQTVIPNLARQLAQRPSLPSSHLSMERSLAVAHEELRSLGF